MIKKFLLSCLCIIPALAQAQETESSLVSFNFGYANYDVSSFSGFMPTQNLAIENHCFALNIESSQIKNRVIFGFDFGAHWQPKLVADSFNVHVSAYEYKLQFGYAAVSRPKFFIAPTIGLGGGYDRIYIFNSNNTTMSNIALDPGREIELRQGKAIADISLRMFALFGDEFTLENNEKWLIGLRVGYRGNYGIGNWKYAKSTVSDGPDGFRQMIYGTICFGILTRDTYVERPFEEGDMQ